MRASEEARGARRGERETRETALQGQNGEYRPAVITVGLGT